MPSMYENLVAKLGPDGAREEMRRRRQFVKKPGFASMSKKKHREISRKGAEAAKKIHEAKRKINGQDFTEDEDYGWEEDDWET